MSSGDPVDALLAQTSGSSAAQNGTGINQNSKNNIEQNNNNSINYPNAQIPDKSNLPNDPVSKLLSQGLGKNGLNSDNKSKDSSRKQQNNNNSNSSNAGSDKNNKNSQITYPKAIIPITDPFSDDPVSQLLYQGKDAETSINPMEELLMHHTNDDLIFNLDKNKSKEENKTNETTKKQHRKSTDNPNNPIVVLGGNSSSDSDDDDDDDGAPITLSVRQPSFSSLHGPLIPKGSTKEIASLEELNEKPEVREVKSIPEESKKKTNNKDNSADLLNNSAEALKRKLGNQENPIIVAGESSSDDDDGDQQIGLNVRQPSFSNLHGQLIPKGATKASVLPSLDEAPAEKPQDQNDLSNLGQQVDDVSSSDSSETEAGGNDDDDGEEQAIGLTMRQPSFASLHGQLIPKGSSKGINVPADELIIVEEPENPSAKEKRVEEKKQETPKEQNQEEDKFDEKPVENTDDDNDGPEEAISLNVRQPSFSNLHGQLIPKGSTKALPILSEEDPVIVEEGPKEDAQEILLNSISAKDPVHGQILRSLHEFNQERWKELGYDPNKSTRKMPIGAIEQQTSSAYPKVREVLIPIEEKSTDKTPKSDHSKPKHVNSGRKQKLVVELPDSLKNDDDEDDEFDKLSDDFEANPMSPQAAEEEVPRLINSAGGHRNPSQIFDILPESMINNKNYHNAQTNIAESIITDNIEEGEEEDFEEDFDAFNELEEEKIISDLQEQKMKQQQQQQQRQQKDETSSKSSKSSKVASSKSQTKQKQQKAKAPQKTYKKSSPQKQKVKKENVGTQNTANEDENQEDQIEGIDSDFYLDLEELKNEQAYDSEQGSNRIPPKLYELIVHPKESVVFLALCGVSIMGYRPKTITYVNGELKKYLNKCVKLGLIQESMYVQNIMDRIKQEKQELKQAQENENEQVIEEQLEEANNEIEKREVEWSRKKEQLEAQRQLALEELQLKYNNAMEELSDEWCSEKMQTKYNKPSPKLIDLRQTAQRLINVHRFEEAARIAAEIEAQEEAESQAAHQRMEADYKHAIQHLNEKYEQDKKTVELTYQSKLTNMEASRDKSLIPAQNRAARVQHEKDLIEQKKKLSERQERAAEITRRSQEARKQPLPRLQCQSVMANKKLALKPLKRIVRPISSVKTKK